LIKTIKKAVVVEMFQDQLIALSVVKMVILLEIVQMKRGLIVAEVTLTEVVEEDVEIVTNQDLELVLNVVKKVIMLLNAQMKINALAINVVSRAIWPKIAQMKTIALMKEKHLEHATNVGRKVIWLEIVQINL
jgi:hypothetical protein